jgi:hypothetical protein
VKFVGSQELGVTRPFLRVHAASEYLDVSTIRPILTHNRNECRIALASPRDLATQKHPTQ